MINYQHLTQAQDYYRIRGYKPMEVPWLVGYDTVNLTCPPGGIYYCPVDNHESDSLGYLVASAEQSFIQLALDKEFLRGNYQAITPCWRGDKIDVWHQRYFVKLELIRYLGREQVSKDVAFEDLHTMLDDAIAFFTSFIPSVVIPVESGMPGLDVFGSTFDIVSDYPRVELGSYGVRYHKDVGTWIYGTGCAEPRLSQGIDYVRNS